MRKEGRKEGRKDRRRKVFVPSFDAARARARAVATLFAAPIRCLEVTERGRERETDVMRRRQLLLLLAN